MLQFQLWDKDYLNRSIISCESALQHSSELQNNTLFKPPLPAGWLIFLYWNKTSHWSPVGHG